MLQSGNFTKVTEYLHGSKNSRCQPYADITRNPCGKGIGQETRGRKLAFVRSARISLPQGAVGPRGLQRPPITCILPRGLRNDAQLSPMARQLDRKPPSPRGTQLCDQQTAASDISELSQLSNCAAV